MPHLTQQKELQEDPLVSVKVAGGKTQHKEE